MAIEFKQTFDDEKGCDRHFYCRSNDSHDNRLEIDFCPAGYEYKDKNRESSPELTVTCYDSSDEDTNLHIYPDLAAELWPLLKLFAETGKVIEE